jgi:hypothetical protein
MHRRRTRSIRRHPYRTIAFDPGLEIRRKDQDDLRRGDAMARGETGRKRLRIRQYHF